MTLTFKIQLRDITKPPVWRRLEIPEDFTFDDLHNAIQSAFGWWNNHLYQFEKSPFCHGWKVKEPSDPCPCGSGKKYKNCCGRGN